MKMEIEFRRGEKGSDADRRLKKWVEVIRKREGEMQLAMRERDRIGSREDER